MATFMNFVHILGAASVGFYILLPFIVGKIPSLSLPAQEGSAVAIRSFNLFAQIGLLIQFITGGYLMSLGNYSVLWMIIVTVLIVGLFAVSGMMSKPLKAAIAGIKEKSDITGFIGKMRVQSAILAVMMVAMLFFMVYRNLI